jgi:DNA polymerase III alpha subunit (gram-positive type)
MKINSTNMDFKNRNLVFIDLETTGLEPYTHEILELACLLVDSKTLEVKDKYLTKVRPSHIDTADSEGLEVVGYTSEKWKDALSLEETLIRFNELAKDAILVGWNIQFDWSMIDAAFSSLKIEANFDYHSIDVCSIAYTKLLKEEGLEKLSLGDVAKFLNIEVNGRHSSIGDIMATFDVYKKLL